MSSVARKVATCLLGWKLYGIAVAREPHPGLWQVIDFQLDKYVTSRRFTINLGLHDTRLEPFFTEWPRLNTERPETVACNLTRLRLGEVVDRKDRWWDLPSEGELDSDAQELCSLLMKFAIPDLDRFRSNQGIAEAWMKSRGPNGSSLTRSPWFRGNPMALAALLKDVRRDQEARHVATAEIEASKGHPSEKWVKTVAARLGP